MNTTQASRARPIAHLRAAVCLVIGLLSGAALADELVVPSAEFPDLSTAVAAAEAGDEIILLDGVLTGEANWDVVIDKPLTIRGQSGDRDTVVIEGPDLSEFGYPVHRALLIFADATIADLTFRSLSGLQGAAALVSAGHASFENVAFRDCRAEDQSGCEIGRGGALAIVDASATLTGCLLRSNKAVAPTCTGTGRSEGGAIWVSGSRLELIETAISLNESFGALTGRGGAIASINSDIFVRGHGFFSNSVRGEGAFGGAIDLRGGSLRMVDGRMTLHRAEGSGLGALGGALNIEGASVTIVSTEVAGNLANASAGPLGGGGIASDHSLSVVGSIFSGNNATGSCEAEGGSLSILSGTAEVLYSNLLENRATCSEGVSVSGGARLGFIGSIVRDGIPRTEPGAILTATYSNVLTLGGVGLPGDGNIDADPLFVDGSFFLGPGSPCIDAASTRLLPLDELDLDGDGETTEPLPIDKFGQTRRVDDPNTVDTGEGPAPVPDMGAYEFQFCLADVDGSGRLDLFDFLAFQEPLRPRLAHGRLRRRRRADAVRLPGVPERVRRGLLKGRRFGHRVGRSPPGARRSAWSVR